MSEPGLAIAAIVLGTYKAINSELRKDKRARDRRQQERELHEQRLDKARAQAKEAWEAAAQKAEEAETLQQSLLRARIEELRSKRVAILIGVIPDLTPEKRTKMLKGIDLFEKFLQDHSAKHLPPALDYALIETNPLGDPLAFLLNAASSLAPSKSPPPELDSEADPVAPQDPKQLPPPSDPKQLPPPSDPKKE